MLRTSQTLYPIVPLSLFLGQFLFQRRGNVCWKLKRRTRLRYPLDLVRLVTICAIGQVIGNLSISHFVKGGGLLLGFSFFREVTEALACIWVESRYSSFPHTNPACWHWLVISSKKRRKISIPYRPRMRVKLEWSGNGSFRS